MLKVVKLNNKPEIFYTVQGEGKSLGRPSVFIRLALCNLYCQWCDTDYTWNWKGTPFTHNYDKLEGYKKYDKQELIELLSDEEIIKIAEGYHCNNIVITGGEPLVQQKDLRSLMAELKRRNAAMHIELETNGTLKPLPEMDELADQYNVSVKLSNSNVSVEDRINADAIAFFAGSPKANFKFVIDEQDDVQEILDLINRFGIKREVVYLMPQGTTADLLKQKQNWVVDICKQYNFNYTDRMHIHIWGNKRGV